MRLDVRVGISVGVLGCSFRCGGGLGHDRKRIVGGGIRFKVGFGVNIGVRVLGWGFGFVGLGRCAKGDGFDVASVDSQQLFLVGWCW